MFVVKLENNYSEQLNKTRSYHFLSFEIIPFPIIYSTMHYIIHQEYSHLFHIKYVYTRQLALLHSERLYGIRNNMDPAHS